VKILVIKNVTEETYRIKKEQIEPIPKTSQYLIKTKIHTITVI